MWNIFERIKLTIANSKVHKLRCDSQDEATNKRVHEHLTNKNDKITDEDISNAITFYSHHKKLSYKADAP
jgi:hypothetical protein